MLAMAGAVAFADALADSTGRPERVFASYEARSAPAWPRRGERPGATSTC